MSRPEMSMKLTRTVLNARRRGRKPRNEKEKEAKGQLEEDNMRKDNELTRKKDKPSDQLKEVPVPQAILPPRQAPSLYR